MRRELIRATSKWRNGAKRYDTVFIKLNNGMTGLQAFSIARVYLFFSFRYHLMDYPCALVDDYIVVGDGPDENTGMWRVKWPHARERISRVIDLRDILRAAHLIPIFKDTRRTIPPEALPETTLDKYHYFYVNKFADHHSFEIAF